MLVTLACNGGFHTDIGIRLETDFAMRSICAFNGPFKTFCVYVYIDAPARGGGSTGFEANDALSFVICHQSSCCLRM